MEGSLQKKNCWNTWKRTIVPTNRKHLMSLNRMNLKKSIKCYACGTMLADNAELMRHKKQQHWKENKCPYFHAVGRGCRFPDHICFNIHWPQEEQRGRGQNQRAGGQVQRSGTQEQGAGSQMQGAGDQASWADVTRGQRVRGQGHNARENIDC